MVAVVCADDLEVVESEDLVLVVLFLLFMEAEDGGGLAILEDLG